jgi:hypothetical protein
MFACGGGASAPRGPKGPPPQKVVVNAVASHRARRREWIALAVLVLPTLLVSLDFNVLHLAVPSLSAARGHRCGIGCSGDNRDAILLRRAQLGIHAS